MTLLSVPVLWLPLDALVPDQSPLAVQDVGLFVLLQFNVAVPFSITDDGLAVSATLGTP